ncbi:MAG: M20/M25/M40 family metallo-hydrolase, partial [Gammaproteobacteria bacterium]|nr:M20/M25/M40 family metallo-hydrolase [Gammaproteobacteria bacterium]
MTCALLACTWLAQAASAAAVIRTPEELRAREIFARVIAYRTSVGLGQVPAMAEYLAGQFRAAGFPAADIHMLPLGETASLVVRYRGDGTGGKPILLLSHMDVVTARREDWQRDPFTLTEENGFFYGRGTFDIKESLTCLVATLLRFKAEGVVPRRDLVLLL